VHRLNRTKWHNPQRREAKEGKKWEKGLDNSGNIEGICGIFGFNKREGSSEDAPRVGS
jgi:hypothetical protein